MLDSFSKLKDMDVNTQEKLSNTTLRHKLKDMDVNTQEKLSNTTLRHKLKERNSLV
jgi:hypothetical protein